MYRCQSREYIRRDSIMNTLVVGPLAQTHSTLTDHLVIIINNLNSTSIMIIIVVKIVIMIMMMQ